MVAFTPTLPNPSVPPNSNSTVRVPISPLSIALITGQCNNRPAVRPAPAERPSLWVGNVRQAPPVAPPFVPSVTSPLPVVAAASPAASASWPPAGLRASSSRSRTAFAALGATRSQ
eukprot:1127343-Prymnesium_polylepis.2